MFSMTGVFIAQLFRLHHSPTPNPDLGFYVASVPLSSVCQIIAIIVLSIGVLRFLKLQNNMSLGKAVTGGWEVNTVALLSFTVSDPPSSVILELTRQTDACELFCSHCGHSRQAGLSSKHFQAMTATLHVTRPSSVR